MSHTRVVEISCGPASFGVNAYLLLGRRPVLVDTGVANCADHILAALARDGHVPRDLSLIVVTHGHLDHTGSVRELAERSGAPVAVHEADAAHVLGGTSAPVEGANWLGRRIAGFVKRQDEASAVSHAGVEPSILLRGGESLEEFGVDGRILHTPGHTAGSVSVLLDGGPALVGDLVQHRLLNRRAPMPSVFAVDPQQLLASIRAVVAQEPPSVYASHAAPFGLEQMRAVFA